MARDSDLVDSALRKRDFFVGFSDDQWARVVQTARERTFTAGSVICRRGDPATHFFFVDQGMVKLMMENDQGQEHIVEIIESGDLFAEAMMFVRSTYPVNGVALKPSTVVAFDCEVYRSALLESPEMSLALMGRLAKRLKGLVTSVRTLTLASAEQRVAGYVLAKADASGRMMLTYPKHVLANRLGMTPESLSRALAKLKRRGLIDVRNREFLVLDRERLADECDE